MQATIQEALDLAEHRAQVAEDTVELQKKGLDRLEDLAAKADAIRDSLSTKYEVLEARHIARYDLFEARHVELVKSFESLEQRILTSEVIAAASRELLLQHEKTQQALIAEQNTAALEQQVVNFESNYIVHPSPEPGPSGSMHEQDVDMAAGLGHQEETPQLQQVEQSADSTKEKAHSSVFETHDMLDPGPQQSGVSMDGNASEDLALLEDVATLDGAATTSEEASVWEGIGGSVKSEAVSDRSESVGGSGRSESIDVSDGSDGSEGDGGSGRSESVDDSDGSEVVGGSGLSAEV